MSKNLSLAALFSALVFGAAGAEEPQLDKFRFAIGQFTPSRVDSNLSLTNTDLGGGLSIDPRDAFDLDPETAVLRIEGYYRFTNEHALTYSWYDLRSDGRKTIDEEFDWVDDNGDPITIPVGANVKASVGTEIFKLGYRWSFYQSEKVELGVGAGLHTTRVTINVDTNLTNPPGSSVERVETTLPLPVVSLGMVYHVTPKFNWYLSTEVFALEFDNYYGTYRDTLAGLEYRAWQHVGLGAALSINTLDLEEDDSKTELNYSTTTTGLLFYVATYF